MTDLVMVGIAVVSFIAALEIVVYVISQDRGRF